MKKVLSILLLLGLLSILCQFIINLSIDHHTVKYSIKTANNDYYVSEKFRRIGDNSVYDFTVLDKDNSYFTFSYEKDFNNQERVIKDFEYYTTKDLKCIFPIYKRSNTSDIACLYKGEQVSYSYLKQIDNYDIGIIIKKLESLGYDNDGWDRNNTAASTSENGKIKFYKKNIMDNYIFTMWNYKGIYIIKNDGLLEKELLDYDQYENDWSALVGKYYVTLGNVDKMNAISEIFYYNIKDLGKGSILVKDSISVNSYLNGVYNNKLYITDLDAEKQYVVDPAYETIEEVGNKELGYKALKDDKLVTISNKEFLKENVYFSEFVSNEKILKKYDTSEIREDGNFYYFKTSDGKVYRAHHDNPYKAVLLFEFPNISEWKVRDGDILVVAGDTLYFYNAGSGLSTVAVNRELLYNYENICDFWKK